MLVMTRQGDSFIVDDGNTIFVWNGKSANRMEKALAVDMANRIKNQDHNGRSQVVMVLLCTYPKVVELLEASDSKFARFWEILGTPGKIADAETAGTDEEEDEKPFALQFVQVFFIFPFKSPDLCNGS